MLATIFGEAIKRSISHDFKVIDVLTATDILRSGGEPQLALELYKVWIRQNEADPVIHAVHFNYAIGLSEAGDLAGAIGAFQEAIKVNPDFLPSYINLGSVLERLGAKDQAVNQWMALVGRLSSLTADNLGHKLIALQQIGRVFEVAKIDRNAEAALKQIIELDPTRREVVQHYINLRQRQCEWPVIVPWGNVTREHLMGSLFPLNLSLYADDPLFQLGNSAYHNRHDVGLPPGIVTTGAWAPPPLAKRDRLRIGYLSSDMRSHAVGFLTVEALEHHDHSVVEVFVYYCGIRGGTDPVQTRVIKAADHWLDVNDLDDRQLARQIVDDGIDILVDLNGYSMNARTKAVALRPAPIIVNWLGYPGTMGSGYHHYIIADDFIIPPEYACFYTEKVARLPCYQPNDRQRVIADLGPNARGDEGLPDAAFVYCCLNGAQKINRGTFLRWMEILRAVPDSVLWLLAGGAETDDRLRSLAQSLGVAADRLVFSERKPNPEHLARYRLADLFVDTFPYGSHTTASDALWMGVPVVTMPGHGFAARVCGSLVRSAGLSDLICPTAEAYVACAIDLGTDRAKLAHYKKSLADNRDSCILFDTTLLVRELEGLYRDMWQEYCEGKLPVPNLTNLDVYREVGMQVDHDAIERPPYADYLRSYHRNLAYRHSLAPFDCDNRVWTREQAQST